MTAIAPAILPPSTSAAYFGHEVCRSQPAARRSLFITSYSTRLERVSSPENLSVAARLADAPSVRDTILAAAAAAHGLPGTDPRAMTHSWLFTGPPGAGRALAAQAFAAALMCPAEPGRGCGTCETCRGILGPEPRHTDLVFIRPEGLTIGVDGVRDMIRDAATRPTVAPWRVVIYDKADRLTDSAANSLLKTVEEPSSTTVLILCAPSTAPEDFSQTLRSRCRHLYIPAPTVDQIVEDLVAEGASPADARLAAVTSLRNVGRARQLVQNTDAQRRRTMAINLAEDIFHGSGAFVAASRLITNVTNEAKTINEAKNAKEDEEIAMAFGAGAKGKGAAKVQSEIKKEIKKREPARRSRQKRTQYDLLDTALVDLMGIYRDALMLKVGAAVEATHPDFSGLAGDLAARVSEEGLVAAQNAIVLCRERLLVNLDPTMALNGLVGRLRIACRAR
ncbi:DNA polymerase III subunit delta' [Corynebacterium phoceense]|uniref:DNA polymerase III subunit delta n=1 Tax=Corynebacterium phoceense TaxID=1686286 RepID=A0A540R982_9CORY|nr:DNA polymerase III subunit delta' [Corynebacterium phoceense]TQE44305.1 DNA polymerase III subunit delta' [Corynebacterium phoceense]